MCVTDGSDEEEGVTCVTCVTCVTFVMEEPQNVLAPQSDGSSGLFLRKTGSFLERFSAFYVLVSGRGSYDEAGLDHMPVVESSKQCSKSHQRERE